MSGAAHFRRQSTQEWADENPVVLRNQIALDEETGSWKIGDGATRWSRLRAYFPGKTGGSNSETIVVSSGAVTLNSATKSYSFLTYRFTGNVTVNGTEFAPGLYLFERVPSEASGWRVHEIAEGEALPGNQVDPIEVTPVGPTFNDLAGTQNDSYVIPNQTGVIYQVDLVTKNPGTYPGTGTVNVTAVAASGNYVLTGTTSWTHVFMGASGWQDRATDDYESPNGTLLIGRTTPTGNLTYTDNGSSDTTTASILDGYATHPSSSGSTAVKLTLDDPAEAGLSCSFDYILDGPNSYSGTGLSVTLPNDSDNGVQGVTAGLWKNYQFDPQGYQFTGFTPEPGQGSYFSGNFPNSGRLGLEQQGTAIRLYYNNVHIATGTLPGQALGSFVRIALLGHARIKNLKIRTNV